MPITVMRAASRATVFASALACLGALAVTSCALRESHFTGSNPPRVSLPDVVLVDDRGDGFTFDRLKGSAFALFFGFTHCPDTCPTTLAKLERSRMALPQAERDRTRIVFVTVDPPRDTPAALHRYVTMFGPGLIGVTGTPQALKTLYGALGIWSVRIGKGPNYDMGHTSTVFFFDPQGNVRTLHDWQDSPADLTHDFKELTT